MGGTTNINSLSVVTQGSQGMASSAPPDVCLTPAPAGPPMPMPYPNMSMSSDLVEGSTSTTIDGMPVALQNSKFVKSSGDEAGVGGGVLSGVNMQYSQFQMFSPNVTIEGQPVARLSDPMLCNAGNTSCPAEVQAPVAPLPPGVDPVPPEQTKLCRLEQLSLTCGHGSRNFRLEVDKHPDALIQVITSDKPEKIQVGYINHCGISSRGCAKIHVMAPDGTVTTLGDDASYSIPLSKRWDDMGKDWITLLRVLIGGDMGMLESYTMYGTTCQATADQAFQTGQFAVIEVYPNASWSADLTFGYQFERKKKKSEEEKAKAATAKSDRDALVASGGDTRTKKQIEADNKKEASSLLAYQEAAKWSLSGKVKAKCGRTDLSLSFGAEGEGGSKDSGGMHGRMFAHLEKRFSQMVGVFGSLSEFYSTDFDIRWPKVALSGAIELGELDKLSTVARKGNFSISGDPLFGAELKIDLLEWLIALLSGGGSKAVTGFLSFLKKVAKRARAAKGVAAKRALEEGTSFTLGGTKVKESLDIGIDFIVGGDIGGGIGWKFDPTGISMDPDKAQVKGGVDFKLEAFVKAEGSVWLVKAAAGANVTIQGADGKGPSRFEAVLTPRATNKKGQPTKIDWDGYFTYSGLAIYYAMYAEISVQGKAKAPAPGDEDDDSRPKNKLTKPKLQGHSEHKDKLWTMLNPFTIDKDPDDPFASL